MCVFQGKEQHCTCRCTSALAVLNSCILSAGTELEEMLGSFFSVPSEPARLCTLQAGDKEVPKHLSGSGGIQSLPSSLQQWACVLLSTSNDDQHQGDKHCCSCSTGTYLLSVPVNSCLCWRRDVAIIIFACLAEGRLWFPSPCLPEVYINHLKLAKNLRTTLWSTAVILCLAHVCWG